MIIQCPKCGNMVSDQASVCPSCGVSLSVSNSSSAHAAETQKETTKAQQTSSPQPVGNSSISSAGWNQEPVKKPSGFNKLILLSIALTVVIFGIGGLFLYCNVIKPRQIDKRAPRYYTFAPSVVLRSSRSVGADFNKIGSLPYGTELITYDFGCEWSEVKVNSVNADGKKLRGYIASPFILNKKDFFLLNSIFGDADSRSVIETSKCRRALLNYFKEQNYIGKLSSEEIAELGLPTPTMDNQWQVYCLPKEAATNNVYFKRILRRDSKYTDFAVIIKNLNTSERKLLFFYFDDDETPHLAIELQAPEYGTIKKISLRTINNERYLKVDYTEQ